MEQVPVDTADSDAMSNQAVAELDVTSVLQSADANPQNAIWPNLLKNMVESIAAVNITGEADIVRLRLWLHPGPPVRPNRFRALFRERSQLAVAEVQVFDQDKGKAAFEVWVQLNTLRQIGIPNFQFAYLAVSASKPLVIAGTLHSWFQSIRASITITDYLILENIPGVPIEAVVARVIDSPNALFSYFMQLVFALSSTGHNKVDISGETLIFRKSKGLEGRLIEFELQSTDESWVRRWVRVYDYIPMFTQVDLGKGSGGDIYDYYHLCRIFLTALKKRAVAEVAVRQFSRWVVESMFELGIPLWYIKTLASTNVRFAEGVRKPWSRILNSLPSNTFGVVATLWPDEECSDHQMVFDQFEDPIAADEQIILDHADRKLEEPLLASATYDHDHLFSFCYGVADEPDVPYLDLHDQQIDKLKKQLELRYFEIHTARVRVKEIIESPESEKLLWSDKILEEKCRVIIVLFDLLMKQRTILDRLDEFYYTRKKYTEGVDAEATETQNLANYITEHYSKVARIVGENALLYRDTKLILPFRDQEVVDYAWLILNNKSLGTR